MSSLNPQFSARLLNHCLRLPDIESTLNGGRPFFLAVQVSLLSKSTMPRAMRMRSISPQPIMENPFPSTSDPSAMPSTLLQPAALGVASYILTTFFPDA
jgi:hypothetical protein